MWLTRNLDGELTLHTCEPVWWESAGRWTSPALELNYNLLPEVTFENSPQEVELK